MNRRIVMSVAVLVVLVLGLFSPQLIERVTDRSGAGDTITVEPIADLTSVVNAPVALFDRMMNEDFSVAEMQTGRNYSHEMAAKRAAVLLADFLERCDLPMKWEEFYQPDAWEMEPMIAVPMYADERAWNAVIWEGACQNAKGIPLAGMELDDTSGAPMGMYVRLPESQLQTLQLETSSDEIASVFADMLGAKILDDQDEFPEPYDTPVEDVLFSRVYGIEDTQHNKTLLRVRLQRVEGEAEDGSYDQLLLVGWPE